MNRIWYGLTLLILAGGLLSACQGGKIVFEGDAGPCYIDEQCPEGHLCSAEGECVLSGDVQQPEDLVAEVQADIPVDVEADLVPDLVPDLEEEVEVIECEPVDEVCDGIDNDCDGEIDEELGELVCGVGACAAVVEACVEGVEQECVAGEPTDEVCDGIDNDCDELTDEDLGTTTCGVGACTVTVDNCVDGVEQECVAGEPTDEVCDGIDNNCSGVVDDGLGTTTCGVGECTVTLDNCISGVVTECVPAGPTDEVCDGLDNDCDEATDEELGTTTCGVGECEATVDNCVDGVEQQCVPGDPTDEVCDGLDNDCDEATDEELGSTTCGVGECEATVDNCVDGVEQECIAGDPTDEVCDGLDNDCDEATDEELGSTTCGVGACIVTVDNCVDGVEQQCVPGDPTDEICDTIDNDCDGQTDELGTTTCGVGACMVTVENCVDGQEQTCVPGDPTDEVCDYVDNDCDGVIDNPAECHDVHIFGRTYQATGGQAIQGATVTLKAAGDCSLVDEGGPALLVLTTNEKGLYDILGFAGEYCLEAEADGYQKMISEDFALAGGETWIVNFPMAQIPENPFVGLCGRVADADTLVPLDGASVVLGAGSPANIVGSAQTDGDGLYCIGGASVNAADDWFAGATYPDYVPGANGPFQFEANVVKFVSFLLAKDVDLQECYADDFETDVGWVASDPVVGAYWHHRENGVTLNTAVPDCVTLSAEEECTPDPGDPADPCPICADGETNNCIPAPGALPYAYDGMYAAWFGVPDQGNYAGTGLSCSNKNGGSGGPTDGTYTSPAIEILPGATNLQVAFWYWYEIEGVDPNVMYERMSVLVSSDGVVFEEIGVLNPDIDTNGAPDQAYTSSGFFQAPKWTWTGLPLGEDLSAQVAAAGEMYVQFKFDTADSSYNGFRGWLVDGLKIRGVDCKAAPGTVKGLVYDADQGKAPVADATVTVKAAGDCDGQGEGGPALYTTTTGGNGFYSFDLPPGDYCVEVVAEGYAKMITEDFTVESEETTTVDFGLQPGNVQDGYIALCGRVADADTLALLQGASVKLGANTAGNVVASSQTNEHGFFCIGGVKITNAQDWFATGSLEGYITTTEGPFAFEANKVKFITLLLAQDLTTVCLTDGFEADTGWVADAPSLGSVWQRLQKQTLVNQATVSGCTKLAPQEDCTPDPGDPNDTCPICATPDELACIPAPGALSRPFDGMYAAWFGNPQQGNYLSTGGSCGAGSGGSGSTVVGNFTSPEIVIPANAENLRIKFWYWFEIEGVDPNTNYDRMEIYLSADGNNFTQVGQLNPSVDTNGSGDEAYTSAGFLQVPSWNQADIPVPADIEAAAKAGGKLWLRFRFNSGDGLYNAFRGWMVDNVSLRGDGC